MPKPDNAKANRVRRKVTPPLPVDYRSRVADGIARSANSHVVNAVPLLVKIEGVVARANCREEGYSISAIASELDEPSYAIERGLRTLAELGAPVWWDYAEQSVLDRRNELRSVICRHYFYVGSPVFSCNLPCAKRKKVD